MSLRTLFWPFIALLLFASCLPVKYGLDELPDQQLRFGSGGGIAGSFQEYLLLANGQIFLFELGFGKSDTFELQALSKSDARILYKEMDSLRLHKYDFNYPGNMSYFIRQADEMTEHTVQWGNPRWEVRPDVAEFFTQLNAIVDNRKVIFDVKKDKEELKDKEPTFW